MSDVKGKKRVEKHEEEQSEEDDDEEEEVETETTTKEAVTIETNEKITFESLGLDASICKACEALNWKNPTPIQEKAIPFALAGKDIIALAETGSGKTGAFALPILHQLLSNPKRLSVLVLAPTRELAVQIHDVFQAIGTIIGAKSVCIVGGVDMVPQAIALAKKPHIITATPGRLVDHLTSTKGFHLRDLKNLVLDEADRMLSMDFEEEINTILSYSSKENRRTMLFSATMTSKVEKLQRASLRSGNHVERVEVATKYTVASNLDQNFIFVPANTRDRYLAFLLNEFSGKSAIVFTATCVHAKRLSLMLTELGLSSVCLHGQMPQVNRLNSLNKFKAQVGKILVATDVAARGLDIPSVDLVINYDVPSNGKDYIHRVGRTARAGRSGKAITIVTQYDVEVFQKIEKNLGQQINMMNVNKSLVEKYEDPVTEALRRANAELREEDAKNLNKKRKKMKR